MPLVMLMLTCACFGLPSPVLITMSKPNTSLRSIVASLTCTKEFTKTRVRLSGDLTKQLTLCTTRFDETTDAVYDQRDRIVPQASFSEIGSLYSLDPAGFGNGERDRGNSCPNVSRRARHLSAPPIRHAQHLSARTITRHLQSQYLTAPDQSKHTDRHPDIRQ